MADFGEWAGDGWRGALDLWGRATDGWGHGASPDVNDAIGTRHEPLTAPDTPADAPLATGAPDVAAGSSLFAGLFDSDKLEPIDIKAMREGIQDELAMQDARAALADRFDVDGAGTGHNVVSEEEFERIAKLYSDIQRGKTDIKFDTTGMKPEDAARMRDLAMNDMANMLQTDSGREMLESLAHNANEKGEHKTTTLSFIDDPTKSDCSRKYGDDLEEQNRLYANDHNGQGNDATIQYAPGQTFMQTGPDGYECKQTGDTVLFHEMAHAYHRTHGTMAGEQRVDVQHDHRHDMDSGIDLDEYQAAGLGRYWGDRMTENQYREDRRYGLGEGDIDYRRRYSPDGNYQGGPNFRPQ